MLGLMVYDVSIGL